MITPADKVVHAVRVAGHHNHRGEGHSDIVCHQFIQDLMERCPALRDDFTHNRVDYWVNCTVPGLTHVVDLILCEVDHDQPSPTLERARICLENKSVITAHGKNRKNRHSDLADFVRVVQRTNREAIVLAHVLVGTAIDYLNVPDTVKRACKFMKLDFDLDVRPRLSTGDVSLWEQFPPSPNRPADPAKTIALMQTLPVRKRGFTHEVGYDALLVEPVFIDNVSAPCVVRDNPFGIDVDAQYQATLEATCRAYTARWHTLRG